MSSPQPDSTLTAIRQKVRRLTASSSEQSLTTATIDQAINTFYQQDFPYAIKLDQLRSVYTFFTSPNVDTYPMNVNFNQGIRSPVYFEGIKGMLFKDRDQFFNMWPRWPTMSQVSQGILSGNIILALQSNPCQISSLNHGLTSGDMITIVNVQGMTQLNNINFVVTVVNVDTFTLNGVNATGFPPQVLNTGNWFTDQGIFSFTVSSTPFLPGEVVIGGTDGNGNAIIINDTTVYNGAISPANTGYLYYQNSNKITPQPFTVNAAPPPKFSPIPLPGLFNLNLSGQVTYDGQQYQAYPGDNIKTLVGSVNYVTGLITLNFAALGNIFPANNTQLTVWVSQYTAGRPYTLLFWNNYFQIRPVPDNVYKVEVETYLTPVQLLETGDFPILNQWWQYISYGSAMEIQRERNDFEGVEGLREGFMRQEALVLERQGIEEIGQRNATLFSSSIPEQGWNQGSGWPY